MASSPIFTATPKIGTGKLDTANTNRDGTGTIVTIFTAGSSGSRIEEIIIKSDGDPADSSVVFYLYDSTTYYCLDEWDIDNPAAGSATVASYRQNRKYENYVLPSGWSLRASITAAPTTGKVHCIALGGDF